MNDPKNIWPGWETVRLIGRGSFGTVYEIKRNVIGNEEEYSAMKVISIPQTDSDLEALRDEGYDQVTIKTIFNEHLESIVKEYSTMKMMNRSQNVVGCEDIRYVQHKDGLGWDIFIKMELLTPLPKALSNDVDDETVIKIGIDICNALELCKENNIVHRDIKPQNIFVSKYGDYKLGDFGIAKTVEKTTGGTKIGTYDFMAPEVYNNQPYGCKADMYSLGLVLYWLLNKRRLPFLPLPPETPITSVKDSAKQRRFMGDKIPEPVNGSFELKGIVLKACSFNENDRFVDVTEMKNALLSLNSSNASVLPPVIEVLDADGGDYEPNYSDEDAETVYDEPITTGTPKKSKNKTIFAVIASVFVIIIAAVLGFAFTGDKEYIDVGLSSTTTSTTEKTDEKEPETEEFSTEESNESSDEETSANDSNPKEESTGEEKTTGKSLPVQTEWSVWMNVDKLPDYITDENYEIQYQTLRSIREWQSTKSKKDSENLQNKGWKLFKVVEGSGGYGEPSSWSSDKPEDIAGREITPQVRYRYETKVEKVSPTTLSDDWIYVETTYSLGDFGEWSDWSTTPVYKTESIEPDVKKQYSYREKETKESSEANLSGWTLENTKNEYGSWVDKGWTKSKPVESDVSKITNQKNVKDYTEYTIFYYRYWNEAYGKYLYTYDSNMGGKKYTKTVKESDITFCKKASGKDSYILKNSASRNFSDEIWFINSQRDVTHVEWYYQTRTKSNIYTYSRWSSWSNWSFEYKDEISNCLERQERTVYRYKERKQIPAYHYYKWVESPEWTTEKKSDDNFREVERRTFYQYRDKIYTTTYYLEKWTEWQKVPDGTITKSDDEQIKIQCCFKSK